ncbi:zwei Ig domain protein zig-8-like isoform X1 [Cataglyphis hispanica]|uniref:zwei Ig domain protein zig-8-like isoform X1 n=1 Tax=Cataglyphis hispanica TaxID=1086592 RepID=UPI00218063C2|nr:zwei Ig domain protein zig-8-like isoform X1 [Cataglyphis hispanica]XP_050458799.1 zwei Ig domain protein zig-8-like isoform X1 [Cataglyphis hispanica]XP_050458800.1 zwei Ig domain protein zig-8-like isoform X1 [Cataglyphis hispanica]XP_050458801.1 zwei Ig domain protein zig-8-like isoform X1 [Cataglyphis hispanica]XP_050458802.1 zwei Ig domain protein zig-8-like isoform X1 [Cataglyphis hispanica]XP_050458803.1 zwei Ig domain protein zig-8-like isoform X1 [Cataglyphis hispanica]XP_05045880
MKGPRRIGGGLPSGRKLDYCQKVCQARGILLVYLTICASLPGTIFTAPAHARETLKEGAQKHLNNANNDLMEDLTIFEPTAANVSAFVGHTAYLPCRVRNLGDKVVSWMRSRDLHILTSGNFSFSSDARFGAQHTPGSDAWTLRLDNARKTDSGKYECQVNTEPKIMYAVQLSVRDPDKSEGHDEPYSQQTRISYESTAPVADIIGPQEQRVPSGSTITLRCVILSPYQTRPIRGVQWLRDNKLLTFQAARGGINVETVRDAARTVSVLTLAAVTQDDVGNYSCRPTEGRSDTVTLVVEEGERTEAMQRDAGYVSSGSNVRHWPGLLLPFPWLLILASNSQTFLL